MTKPIDYGKSTVKAKKFIGEIEAEISAVDVDVAAYPTSGISAGNLQAVLEALADRVEALENQGG